MHSFLRISFLWSSFVYDGVAGIWGALVQR